MRQSLLLLALVASSASFSAGCSPPSCDEHGIACDWAGHLQVPGFNGDGKAIRDAYLYNPMGVKFAPDGTPWVIDWNNHRVRKVVNGNFKTVIGTGFPGDGDAANADLTAAGATATECLLNHPTDLVFKPDGTAILDAWHNHKIRLINDTTNTEWVESGRGYGYFGDGPPAGPWAKALYSQEKALALAPDGTLYILDQRNQRIRKVDPTTQTISCVAGNGMQGFGGDGADPLLAELNFETGDSPLPSGALALDAQGKLYVLDSLNNRLRVIDFAANTINTIAGNGTAGFAGDNGPALQAELNNPKGLGWGPDGRLYIADTENAAIRAIDLTTNIITTVAGTGKQGAGGENQLATKVELSQPYNVDFDLQGNMYISDTYNNRIIRVAK